MSGDNQAYAEALQALAKQPAETLAELQQLIEVLQSVPSARQALVAASGRPTGEADRITRRILADFSELITDFVSCIVRDRMVGELADIADRYRLLLRRTQKFSEVVIESVVPLSPTECNRLAAAVTPVGSTAIVRQITKPSLIGGLRVIVDDQVFDASLGGSLDQLTQQLAHV